MKYDTQNPLEAKRATAYLAKLIEVGKVAEVREVKEKRSTEQNAYWHVCCGLIGDHCGYTTAEVKILIKRQLEWMIYRVNGEPFLRSSTDLDTREMTELIEFTRDYGEDAGCYVPTPDEYREHWRQLVKYLQD